MNRSKTPTVEWFVPYHPVENSLASLLNPSPKRSMRLVRGWRGEGSRKLRLRRGLEFAVETPQLASRSRDRPHSASSRRYPTRPRLHPSRRDKVLRRFHLHPPLLHPDHLQLARLLQMRFVHACPAGHPAVVLQPYVWEQNSIRRTLQERLIPNAALHEIRVVVPVKALESFGRNDVETPLSLIRD